MKCRESSRLISAAALGEIGEEQKTSLREHLSVCEKCSRRMRITLMIVELVDCALTRIWAGIGLSRSAPSGPVSRTG